MLAGVWAPEGLKEPMGLVYESGRRFFLPSISITSANVGFVTSPSAVLLQDEFKGGPWGPGSHGCRSVTSVPPSQVSEGGGLCCSAHFLFLIQSSTPAHHHPPPRLVSIVRNCPRLGFLASFHSKGASGWRQTEKTVLTFLLTSGIFCVSCSFCALHSSLIS